MYVILLKLSKKLSQNCRYSLFIPQIKAFLNNIDTGILKSFANIIVFDDII